MVTKKLTSEEKEERARQRRIKRAAGNVIDTAKKIIDAGEKVIASEAAAELKKSKDGQSAPASSEESSTSKPKVKAKKLPSIINTKRYTAREVKIDLTPKEINEAGIELAHKQKQYAEVEEEMKGHMSNYKDRLKEIHTQMNTLGNKVTLKYEYRKFSCEIWLNFKTKERVYKDRDTRKVIDTAGLEADDYQLRLAV